jgi:hypothetical protein
MEVISGLGEKKPKPNLKVIEYNNLLAKIHIAARELKISRKEYLNILARSFGVGSATCLSHNEMRRLLKIFKGMGWKVKPPAGKRPARRDVILVWQEQARNAARQLGSGWEKRLRETIEEECGVANLAWCQDIGVLQRVCRRLEESSGGNDQDPKRSGSSGR